MQNRPTGIFLNVKRTSSFLLLMGTLLNWKIPNNSRRIFPSKNTAAGRSKNNAGTFYILVGIVVTYKLRLVNGTQKIFVVPAISSRFPNGIYVSRDAGKLSLTPKLYGFLNHHVWCVVYGRAVIIKFSAYGPY